MSPKGLGAADLDVTAAPSSPLKTNLVKNHIQDFPQPATASRDGGARASDAGGHRHLLLFLLVIIYARRLDFSISKEEGSATRGRRWPTNATRCAHHDSRCSPYQSMEDSNRQGQDQQGHGCLPGGGEVADGQSEGGVSRHGTLSRCGPRPPQRLPTGLPKLQRQDKALREYLAQHVAVGAALAGKLGKPQFASRRRSSTRRRRRPSRRWRPSSPRCRRCCLRAAGTDRRRRAESAPLFAGADTAATAPDRLCVCVCRCLFAVRFIRVIR